MLKKILKSSIGIIIGGVFLYLTLRNKPLGEIFQSVKNAHLLWIIASVIGLLAIFYFRALRWKVLLSSAGYETKRYNVIYALMVGYFVNSFTPKLGEIFRCTSLSKCENVPVSKSFGSVVSERIYDVLVLLLGFLAIAITEISHIGNILLRIKDNLYQIISAYYLYAIIATILLLITTALLYRVLKKNKFAQRISNFVKEFIVSLKDSFKMKNYKSFIILTILIWLLLILINYSYLRSLPETSEYSMYFASMVLFIGGIGWALPSPGGIGTTNFIILQLFVAYNLDENVGVSFGLLTSGITFGVTVVFGFLAIAVYYLHNLYNKKYKSV